MPDCNWLSEVLTKYAPEKGDMNRMCRRGPCRRSWEALTSMLLSNYIGLDCNAEKIFFSAHIKKRLKFFMM